MAELMCQAADASCQCEGCQKRGSAALFRCLRCAEAFRPKRSNQVTFCGRPCAYAYRAEAALRRAESVAAERKAKRLERLPIQGPPEPKRCSCGSYVLRKYARGRCEQCAASEVLAKRRANHATHRKTEAGRRSKSKWKASRRALLRGVKVEPVDPINVFVRDRWRCQLCGVRTPQKLRGANSPLSPELDHIIPLSQGGEHSYRNTQLACRRCNLAKGGTVLGQMRLF